MECYFLKIKITEFIFNQISENLKNNQESNESNQNKELIKNDNNINYEIQFDLMKSNERYTLKIINDNNGSKIPFSNYFTIPTSINIDKENNIDIFNLNNFIDDDSLEISLYTVNNEKKLVDIDNDVIIDNNCINQPKFAEINLGYFHIKLLFKLSLFEDLCIRENDMILMINNIDKNNEDNINIDKKHINNLINDENINLNNNNDEKKINENVLNKIK